ncbi:MAG: Fic family protein [Oscillospiraceae bacterium]|nr:Fic family protein [Oscillospiraceae bacterium]
MRPFAYKAEYQKLLTPEIVSYLTQIHEQKGKQSGFSDAQEDVLGELLEIAKIQSTEASNRIEGIITTDDRLKLIVRNKTTPRNRSEREIAGYRDVLNTIHENYDFIPIRPGMILQLHRDLYKFSGMSIGGSFKNSDNVIAETLPGGTKRLRFQPVPAWETSEAMDSLCTAINEAIADPEMDDLLLLPMFILDFLCIHPFNDGNGRMSRLLTLLLLYRTGYPIGKYISIERLIADSKDSYYETLQASSENWHEGGNDYLPFVRYLLGVIIAAYREFTERAEIMMEAGNSKISRIRSLIRSTTGRVTKAELMAQCPDISQVTIQRALKELTDKGDILKIGGGRYTSYTWNWEKEQEHGYR